MLFRNRIPQHISHPSKKSFQIRQYQKVIGYLLQSIGDNLMVWTSSQFIFYTSMSCILGCLCYCCCDILCCECNQYVFPAPRSTEYMVNQAEKAEKGLWEFSSFNSEGRTVPYLKISNTISRKSKKCFIYFHGNGEDIGFLGYFLQPIFQVINITFYAIEYPTYGKYETACSANISNRIKQDSINFYSYLMTQTQMKRSKKDIYVMGRSIGSGGATYLAANRPVPILVLISPFDTVKKVSTDFFKCLGSLVKNHFNNQQQIIKFEGKLLVIHGENDQTIRISHAKNLVQTYETKNAYKNKAIKVYPPHMTHNRFLIKQDIIDPLVQFMDGIE